MTTATDPARPPEGGLPMNVPSDGPCRYRIVFRGECGDAFAGVFNDAAIESRHGHTWVVAAVRDRSEFYGLLDRLQDLALQPVSINELGADRTGPGSVSACSRSRLASTEVDTMAWLTGVMVRDPAVKIAGVPMTRGIGAATLDARSHALIRLAGLAACGQKPTAVHEQIVTAVRHGVSPGEIAGALIVLLPTIGAGRFIAAASDLRHILGDAGDAVRSG